MCGPSRLTLLFGGRPRRPTLGWGGVGQSSYLGVWGVRGVSEGVGDGIIQYIDGYQAFYTISGVVIPQRRVP